MSVKAPSGSAVIHPEAAALSCPVGDLPLGLLAPLRGTTVVAGLEDTLAVLRTAVLLARNLRATLHLVVPGTERLEIHFGSAPCHALLLGLLEAIKARLSELASAGGPNFVVVTGLPSGLQAVSIQIQSSGSAGTQYGI